MRSPRTDRPRLPGIGPGPERKRTGRSSLVAATAAATLLAAACGAADTATDSAASGSEAAQAGAQLDAAVFNGEAITVSGDAFDLGTLADKDLVLWFWAPW